MLTKRRFSPIAIALLAVAASFLASVALPAADEASADEPVITYTYPENGDVFGEPLLVLQICFEEPIDVRDLPPQGEGDFMFRLQRPNGFNLGMRIVFQANGYGVAIYPGIAEDGLIGEWTLTFTVRDRETLDPITQTITYEVQEGGAPVITPTPQMCPTEGRTFAPTQPPATGPDRTPEPNGDGVGNDDDSGPDLLVISLLTIGAAGAAAVVGLLGYVFRRRIGWWLHKPEDDAGPGEHH